MTNETLKIVRTAIANDDLNTIKTIVERDNSVIKEVSIFGSILQIASREGKEKIVKFLVDKNCDVNLGGGIYKKSPITEAAFNGHIGIVDLLVKKGATLDVSTFENNPLFSAIYNRHTDVAKFLIDHGIDIMVYYSIGQIDKCDACEYARQYGLTETYEYLKELKKNDSSTHGHDA